MKATKFRSLLSVGRPLWPVFRFFTASVVVLHFSFFISLGALAQTTTRIELPVVGDNSGYQPIALGKQGVLVVNPLTRSSFVLQKFNSDLTRDWQLQTKIEDGLDFVKSSFDGTSVYLLFSRARTDFYQVVKVNIGPGYIETFYLSAVEKFEITDFQTLGYSVFMAGTVRNEPLLIYTNLLSKQSRVLPTISQPNSVIQSVEADTAKKLINVCYAIRKNREIRLVAKTYNETGEALGQTMVVPDDDYSLINGRLFVIDDSTKIMVGTYGYRNMQSNNGSASQGLFLSKIVYDEVEFTNYNSFTDFQNFFSFMSERQQERMQRKIEKKKNKGDELKLNYRLLVHDVIKQNNDYLIVGEVFYPEYRNNMNNYGYGNSMWGMSPSFMSPFNSFYSPFRFGLLNPYFYDPFWGYRRANNNQIFNGFVYTHAILASFNTNGDRLWDNSLPFENMKSMELKEKVRVKLNEDRSVALSYSNNGQINTKLFAQDKAVSDPKTLKVTTDDATDHIKRTTTDEVIHWFNDYYLAFGYQRIAGADGRRDVFYLNKISF